MTWKKILAATILSTSILALVGLFAVACIEEPALLVVPGFVIVVYVLVWAIMTLFGDIP